MEADEGLVRGRSRQHSLTPEASSWESLDSKEGENEGTGREWTDHRKALRWAGWAQEGKQRLHPKTGWSNGAGVARCEKQGRDSLGGPMAKTPSSLPMQGSWVRSLVRELIPHVSTKSSNVTAKDPACHN